MLSQSYARYEIRANIAKALGHPTRLFVVDQLTRSGPQCVCELTELIGADMSTVSRHLTILKNAGLIGTEKRGPSVYYHLETPCVLKMFDALESVVECTQTDSRGLLAENVELVSLTNPEKNTTKQKEKVR